MRRGAARLCDPPFSKSPDPLSFQGGRTRTGVAKEVAHGHLAGGRTGHVHGRGARLERRRWAEGDRDAAEGRDHFVCCCLLSCGNKAFCEILPLPRHFRWHAEQDERTVKSLLGSLPPSLAGSRRNFTALRGNFTPTSHQLHANFTPTSHELHATSHARHETSIFSCSASAAVFGGSIFVLSTGLRNSCWRAPCMHKNK